MLGVALAVGAATTVLVTGSTVVEHQLEVRDRASVSTSATFFSAHGRKIRYRLVGADRPGPTVVLVSGFGASLEQLDHVQDGLGAIAPTLAYDRGGTGFSDPLDEHDAAAQADEIAAFPATIGKGAPFVLVSYSSSGFIPAAFARLHPELLGGLVFLDVTPPEQVIGLSLKELYHRRTDYERPTLLLAAKASIGWTRFKYWLASRTSTPQTRHDELVETVLESGSHWWAVYREGVAIGRAAEEAEVDWSAIHAPVAVLSLGRPDGDAESRKRYRLHRRLAEQARGRFIHRPGWTHAQIPLAPESVAEVVQIIGDVVSQARGGRKPEESGLGAERAVEEVSQTAHVVDR